VRVLLVTDSFPPNCGGSGWSTFELARGLVARGHAVEVVQPRPRQRGHRRTYEGIPVDEFGVAAPPVPFVRNYFKNERLWRLLEDGLVERLTSGAFDIVHAQHVLTTVPAIRAGARASVPVVATVRDYWPVCYWSDLIIDPASEVLCPACTAGNMRRCLRPRAGVAWPLAVPLVPYMRANLGRKRRGLARADAIIAVSSAIESDLRARAPELAGSRVIRIPNPVDIAGVQAAASRAARPLDGPYVLYSGKLEVNKGADLLVRVAEASRLRLPLVVVGDGRLRPALERDAMAHGLDVRFVGWLPRDEALGWVRHARALVFPSRGPESLSRVLLEAAALGVPLAAMDTGGTRDIVQHEITGLLSPTADRLAADLARLLDDAALAERLGAAARRHVEATFDQPSVVARIEAEYQALVGQARREG
jgi:glycogen(starch) synthase